MKRSNYESGIMGLFPVPRTPWERRLHVVGQLPLYLFILLLCDSRFGIIPEGVRTPLLLICGIPGSIELYYNIRRWRARTRWAAAGIFCFTMSIVWLVIMPILINSFDPSDTEILRLMLLSGGCMVVATGICYLFWRRSVARAQWRLQTLLRERRQRRKREI